MTEQQTQQQQRATKTGFLYSEQMGWARLWFVVLNKYLFQFADNTVCFFQHSHFKLVNDDDK